MKYTLHIQQPTTLIYDMYVDECFLLHFAMTDRHSPDHPNLKTIFELKVKCTKSPPHSLITYILIYFCWRPDRMFVV